MKKKAAQVEIRALTITQVAQAQIQEAIVGVEVTQEVNQAQVVTPVVIVEAVAEAKATVTVIAMKASPRKRARRER